MPLSSKASWVVVNSGMGSPISLEQTNDWSSSNYKKESADSIKGSFKKEFWIQESVDAKPKIS